MPKESLQLEQRQRLQQRMSPLQVRLMHLIESPRTAVEEEVRRELDDNPALEVSEPAGDAPEPQRDEEGNAYTESGDDLQRADYRDDDDTPYYLRRARNYSADDEAPTTVVVAEESLIDHLTEQLADFDLTPRQRALAEYVIGEIDSNGYLRATPDDIAYDATIATGIDISEDEAREAIDVVRRLDPPGIAATDLRDCILLQLNRLEPTPSVKLARLIIEKHYDEYSKRHFERVASLSRATLDEVSRANDVVRSLNPKPGSAFASSRSEQHSQQVIPDFEIDTDGDTIHLTMPNSIPELHIEESFDRMYHAEPKPNPSRTDAEAAAYVKQKYDAATGFIRILRQRQETLLAVMSAIIEMQRDYFLTGDEQQLRPMVLRDIAERCGRDVSVISRATAGKYAATPWGSIELRRLFSEGLGHESGEEVSARKVKARIKELIDAEDKRKPLSDERIYRILTDEGYDIARRTVAKYRDQLAIPVSRLRKE